MPNVATNGLQRVARACRDGLGDLESRRIDLRDDLSLLTDCLQKGATRAHLVSSFRATRAGLAEIGTAAQIMGVNVEACGSAQ